jgi:hypothetical protein
MTITPPPGINAVIPTGPPITSILYEGIPIVKSGIDVGVPISQSYKTQSVSFPYPLEKGDWIVPDNQAANTYESTHGFMVVKKYEGYQIFAALNVPILGPLLVFLGQIISEPQLVRFPKNKDGSLIKLTTWSDCLHERCYRTAEIQLMFGMPEV